MKQLTNSKQSGMSHLLVPLFIIILAIDGYTGYTVMKHTATKGDTPSTATNSSATSHSEASANWSTATSPTWTADGRGEWISVPYDTAPPACPDPIRLALPTPQIS